MIRDLLNSGIEDLLHDSKFCFQQQTSQSVDVTKDPRNPRTTRTGQKVSEK
jgi:hypothetical protein